MVCCSTLTTSVRNGAPHVSTFAKRSSASFNSQAPAVWIRGTAGAVRISGAVGILDRVRRERRAVAAVGVARRIRIIRVRAELAAIVSLLVITPRSIWPAVVPMYEYKTRPQCFCANVRGKKLINRGSSPLAWGTPRSDSMTLLHRRFIPTRVGNTELGPPRPRATTVHPHSRGEH